MRRRGKGMERKRRMGDRWERNRREEYSMRYNNIIYNNIIYNSIIYNIIYNSIIYNNSI